jgi:hypothetical protein
MITSTTKIFIDRFVIILPPSKVSHDRKRMVILHVEHRLRKQQLSTRGLQPTVNFTHLNLKQSPEESRILVVFLNEELKNISKVHNDICASS